MKRQEQLLRRCILVIAVTFALGIGFAYATRLREPVFLTFCVEVSTVPEPESGYHQPVLELQYLTNTDDQKNVTGISFLQAPDISFRATEYIQNYGMMSTFGTFASQKLGETIGRYSLRKVYVFMDNYFLKDWKGQIELNTARIQFNDGSTVQADLGRIILYSEDAQNWGFAMSVSSSSNQGEASTDYRASRNLSNITLQSPLLSDAGRRMELSINGQLYEDFSSMKCSKGEKLLVRSRYRKETETGTEGAEYDFYDVRPVISYTGEDGSQGALRIYDMTYRRYFYSYLEVLKYLRSRGKI
jgi:hypothetical protein